MEAFEAFKEALTKAPVLQFPQWDQIFYIKTDESVVGLRAALTQ